MPDKAAEDFASFIREVGPRLKQALIAAVGGEAGREATAEALAWAWEHWDELSAMTNPAGYLYRLGKNRARSVLRRKPVFPPVPPEAPHTPWVEPALPDAVARLSEMQRITVMLIHGFGWTQRQVAQYLDVSAGTVQTHVERGMAKLRADLKVEIDA